MARKIKIDNELHIKIKCNIYKVEYVAVFTENIDKTLKKYSNKNNDNTIAATIRFDGGSSVIVLLKQSEIDYPTLAHECIHAVKNTFDVRGVELNDNDIEHFTYTVEWLMREIIKRWKSAMAKNVFQA